MPRGIRASSGSSLDYFSGMRLDGRYDFWLCTKCKAEYAFPREDGAKTRAGPRHRGLDRRYGWYYCWRSCKKRVIVRHVATPKPSPQPEQNKVLLRRLYGDEGNKGRKKKSAEPD